MADHRRELRSRYDELRRLHDDLYGTTFARQDWRAEVVARRTLGSDDRIEHWFLAEHFLITWSNWRGLFDRFRRYFGQPVESFPKTWSTLIAKCDALVSRLARESMLDEILARTWTDPDYAAFRPGSRRRYDIATIYSQIARGHERAELLNRSEKVELRLPPRKEASIRKMPPGPVALLRTRKVVDEQNERLLERWHGLPASVQDRTWDHLRHYLHSVLGVSWLTDATPSVSALVSLAWRRKPVTRPVRRIIIDRPEDTSTSASLERLLDRLQSAIGELGYEAVVEDLISDDLIGGDDSLLASDEIMVIPGHMDDASRPILLAVTKGWNGKDPLSFTRVMRQVKAHLTAARGRIEHVVVLCDAWDSASFEEEHREELEAHARQGVRFSLIMVGVPDRLFVPIPVGFDRAPR